MISIVVLALQMLSVPAQNPSGPGVNIGKIAPIDLTGCDASVSACFSNVTALISPDGCGLPAIGGNGNSDNLKWVQCACPQLGPLYDW